MTNGHNAHGGAAVAEAHGGAHPASIDDLLEKATSQAVTQRAIDIHQDIIDSRLSLLEEFYKKGLVLSTTILLRYGTSVDVNPNAPIQKESVLAFCVWT